MEPPLDLLDLLSDVARAPYDGWNWLADEIFLALSSLFARYGAPIVFVAALAEATVVVGVVFPGVVLMFLAAAYTAEQGGSLELVFVLAVFGTIIGDTVSYGLGRWGSRWLSQSRFRNSLRLGEALTGRYARWLIPFYHLHSATRAVGPVGSGALRLPLRIWLPLDYLGAVFSNGVWMGAGAVLGQAVLTERGTLEPHPALRIGLVVLAFAWVLFARRALLRSMRELPEKPADDARVAEESRTR